MTSYHPLYSPHLLVLNTYTTIHKAKLGREYLGLCIQPCTCKNNATMSFHFHYVAFGALAITLLHVCWGVMWFDGWERRRWWWVVLVPVSHMVISCLVCTYTHTIE